MNVRNVGVWVNSVGVALACSASAAWIATASAQETATKPSAVLEEIIVTARRREEALQKVPVAVTALDQEALVQQSITQLEDIRFAVAGLYITPSPQSNSIPALTIRSQRQQQGLLTVDPSVPVYVNEVIQARPYGLNVTLYDIDSVQVLKGPQGTLFGRNSTGGAMLVSTKQPVLRKWEGSAALKAGNYDAIEAEGVVNIPAGEIAAIRVAGNIRQHDGYTDIVNTGRDTTDQDAWSARVSLLVSPHDKFESLTVVDAFSSEDNGTGYAVLSGRPNGTASVLFRPPLTTLFGVANFQDSLARQIARDDNHKIESDTRPFGKVDVRGISNTTQFEFGNLTLKNIAGFRTVDLNVRTDFDGSPAPILQSELQIENIDQVSEELQLLGSSGPLEWIMGAYYFREEGLDSSVARILDIPPRAGVVPSSTGGEAKNTSYSVFAQGTYELTPRLSLTAGSRFSWDKRELNINHSIDPTGCRLLNAARARLPLSECFTDQSKTFTEPTWTVSLDYELTDDALVYLAHRKGYRAGGFNIRAESVEQREPFGSETVLDVEAGAKLDWNLGGMPGRTNIALYHQWYDDIQRDVSFVAPSGTVASSTINAAEATIYGAEMELSMIPIPGLEISSFYAYSHPEFSEFMTIDPVTRLPVDQSHFEFANAPKHTGALTIRYTWPSKLAVGELAVQANAYAQSGFQLSDGNEPEGEVDGYELLNLRVDCRDFLSTKLDVSFFMNNVLDEEYILSGTTLQNTLGFTAGFPGDPRTYGVELRYAFGR